MLFLSLTRRRTNLRLLQCIHMNHCRSAGVSTTPKTGIIVDDDACNDHYVSTLFCKNKHRLNSIYTIHHVPNIRPWFATSLNTRTGVFRCHRLLDHGTVHMYGSVRLFGNRRDHGSRVRGVSEGRCLQGRIGKRCHREKLLYRVLFVSRFGR